MKRAALFVVLALVATACKHRPPVPPPRAPLFATSREAIGPAPPAAPLAPFVLPEVHERTLANGLTVIIARRRSPSATVVFANRGAARRDERAFRGLTRVMARALLRGTETDQGVVRSLLDSRGYSASVGSAPGGLLVTARLFPTSVPAYLPLLAQSMRRPAFHPDDVSEILADEADRERSTRRSFATMVERRLATALYDASDRRSRDPDGSMRTLSRVTPAHLALRHRQAFVPSQSAVIVAGDVDVEATFAAVERAFADWSATGEPPRIEPPRYAERARARVLGIVAGGTQSHVRMRERAPALGHPDHPAFLVLTRLLGGMFSARLNMELRQRLGASYGFNAQYSASSTEGELELGTAVDIGATLHAMHGVVRELRRVRGDDGGITEDELEVARTQAREALVAELETSRALATEMASFYLAGLPPRAIEERIRRVDALGVEELHAAARRWLRPDSAPFVVTSRWDFVHGPLRFAGLGSVETANAPSGRSH